MATIRPSALLKDSSVNVSISDNSCIGDGKTKIYGFPNQHAKIKDKQLRCNPLRLEASKDSIRLTPKQENHKPNVEKADHGGDQFSKMKERFLTFKKERYLEYFDHYSSLAKAQAPKFMVIACADSRVCPSYILGFQPGDAFMIRNVGNLVPPFQNGPTETNAALEFSVNTLEVENIMVIGHSCCGGIQALMSMEEEVRSSSFIKNWVSNAKDARLSTKTVAANLSFDQQCKYCEKESINRSLLNLISYPWIEERVRKRVLSIHGGYYDFVNCTFEKWTLDYHSTSPKSEGYNHTLKNREFWS
ncbi:hypothetical protein MKW94_019036 [Papaver nudicaule]|uniref:Carbonic anhydrase n=1 Tax=Papaver nudicaule TaxID=74823 RepID=A0AA41S2R8_PAPNU|nr:hypothetical protein [Papaver nudicaule]